MTGTRPPRTEENRAAPLGDRLRLRGVERIASAPPTQIRNPQGKRKNKGFAAMAEDRPWVVRLHCGFLDYRSNPLEARQLVLLLVIEAICRDDCFCLIARDLADHVGRSMRSLNSDLAELQQLGWIHHRHLGARLGIILLDRADHLYPYANTPEMFEEALGDLALVDQSPPPVEADSR